MNKIAVALLCATVLPVAAQTKVLVAKSRVPSVTFDEHRSFALPTDCDEQGRSYVKLGRKGIGGRSSGTDDSRFPSGPKLSSMFFAPSYADRSVSLGRGVDCRFADSQRRPPFYGSVLRMGHLVRPVRGRLPWLELCSEARSFSATLSRLRTRPRIPNANLLDQGGLPCDRAGASSL